MSRVGQWWVVVALLGTLSAEARQLSAGSDADPAVLGSQEWAAVVLAPCREADAAAESADAALQARLDLASAPREDASFLQREAAAREFARANARRGALARLTTLLFAFKARVSTSATNRRESFGDVIEALLADADACAIDAVEATLLAGLFGLPHTEAVALRLRRQGPFAVAEETFLELAARGLSAERIFEQLRPSDDAEAVGHIDAVLRAATVDRRAPGDQPTPEQARRLRQVLELVPHVLEPLRIRFYLHAKVDAVEGVFGVTLDGAVDEYLLQLAERKLFDSVDAMRRLSDSRPADTVAALDPLVERWFRRTVLPGLARAIRRDPHLAYAFFAQSGAVVRPGPVWARGDLRSDVVVQVPAYSLEDLRGLPLSAALAKVTEARVPGAFVEAFTRVETASADITFAADDVRLAIARRPERDAMKARMRGLLFRGEEPRRVSSLDVFGAVIRDASKIRGRLDRAALRATIGLVVALKAQQVNLLVGRELDAYAGDDPRFAAYLRTATALMLERERRQATDGVFQQALGGAAVGFILRTLYMGGALPVSLQVSGGVAGDDFGAFVDSMTPKNALSGDDYRGRPAAGIRLVHDGREYHEALVEVIDSARDFLNVSAFDWKTDTGGRDIAYRLMAKKLGIDGPAYARFVARFAAGLPMDSSKPAPVAFYDMPATRMKDLLVWQFFMTTDHPDVAAARTAVLEAGATLDCATVMTCGALERIAVDGPDHARGRRALEQLEALFADRPPAPGQARSRRALRDYIEDPDDLRRFVRRTGLRRADRPDDAFPITIVADGKQAAFNYRWGEPSQVFPYVVTEPVRDIYFMLLEFDIHLVLWKAPVEFPWNVGAVPWPGRYVARRVPMPFVPWPWLGSVPGFGWAGTTASLTLQWLLASDVRMWWASVNHTKSWSSESMALESGMGMASKYFNTFDTHKTWHDMGVVVRGPIVHDVNDHFVQVFNQARINNGGLSASRGARIRGLRYEDYGAGRPPSPDVAGESDGDGGSTVADEPTARAWLLTTHPENGDANYRGVFTAALAAARHNIYIENSFFSDPLVARLLMRKAVEFRARVTCEGVDVHTCAARRRDAVQIYIVLPDTSDKPIVDAVGAADFFEMLDLGIKVHRWNPRAGWSASRMLHSKVWLVDYQSGRGGLAYVGAANATQRSHFSDNEAGILSNDRRFATDVYERIFVPDLTRDSRRETGENFRVLRASNGIVAGSRWLRRLLVELLWLI